jgi:hypothetical protein
MMPEPATEQAATEALIEAWADSPALKCQLAARIARDIAPLPPNTLFDATLKIESKYEASHSVAVGARNLLTDANLIHKDRWRYYTGRAAKTEPNTTEANQ